MSPYGWIGLGGMGIIRRINGLYWKVKVSKEEDLHRAESQFQHPGLLPFSFETSTPVKSYDTERVQVFISFISQD